METWFGLAGRHVDPVFQHSWRHCLGSYDLVKAGSVGFVEAADEHVRFFFVAKKAGAQRFMNDARASNRHILRPPSGPLLTGEGLCHVEFQERLRTLRTGLSVQPISRTRSIRCASLDGCGRFLHCPLFSHPKLATQEKRFLQKRVAPDSLIYPCPCNTSNGFLLGDVPLSRCRHLDAQGLCTHHAALFDTRMYRTRCIVTVTAILHSLLFTSWQTDAHQVAWRRGCFHVLELRFHQLLPQRHYSCIHLTH